MYIQNILNLTNLNTPADRVLFIPYGPLPNSRPHFLNIILKIGRLKGDLLPKDIKKKFVENIIKSKTIHDSIPFSLLSFHLLKRHYSFSLMYFFPNL